MRRHEVEATPAQQLDVVFGSDAGYID